MDVHKKLKDQCEKEQKILEEKEEEITSLSKQVR